MSAAAGEAQQRIDERFAERRAGVERERQRRRRRLLGSAALLLAVAVAALAVARSPLLGVTEVRVLGAAGEQAAAARDATGIEPGDNLLAADIDEAASEVAGLPWVADVEVARELPAVIEVRIAPREAAAVVRLAESSWTVDAEGVVLGGGAADGLVRVDAPQAQLPRPGERIEDRAVLAALEFHQRLGEDFASLVRRYEAPSRSGLRMRLEIEEGGDRVWVRVGGPEDAQLKAEVVATLLAEERQLLTPRGQEQAELDVSAPANPVVVPAEEGS